MGVFEVIIGALVLIISIIIIFMIVLQQGRRAGINGAIAGGAETFLSKNKARSVEAKLERFTKYIAIVFFILVVVANIIALRK